MKLLRFLFRVTWLSILELGAKYSRNHSNFDAYERPRGRHSSIRYQSWKFHRNRLHNAPLLHLNSERRCSRRRESISAGRAASFVVTLLQGVSKEPRCHLFPLVRPEIRDNSWIRDASRREDPSESGTRSQLPRQRNLVGEKFSSMPNVNPLKLYSPTGVASILRLIFWRVEINVNLYYDHSERVIEKNLT